MSIEIFLKKMYSSFVPVDEAGLELMASLKIGGTYKAVFTKPKGDQRRVAQNRLMWRWLTDMQNTQVNEFAGTTKEDWHLKMKRKFLINIYERDDSSYADMVESLRDVYRAGLKKEFEVLLNGIADKTSTTEATVTQFTEYLECIERYAHSCGISLKTDLEMYNKAFNNDE